MRGFKMIDTEKIRVDFPILQRKVNGKQLVYLDNAATTQKPVQVINAISDFYKNYNSNVRHDIHTLGLESSNAYEAAHEKAKDFINASSADEIIFTKNATESINLVAGTFALSNIQKGDEILTTILEHHSNFVPWQIVAREKGVKLVIADINKDGTLNMEDFKNKLSSKTKLVAVTHCSNVLGTITPVKEITKSAHEVEAKVLVDGAQSAPFEQIDVQDLNADFFAFSGHKMLGPTGIGVLYGKKEFLEEMPTYISGGHMVDQVWEEKAEFASLPWKFEAGTPDISGGIGLAAAIDYLQNIGMNNVKMHEQQLTKYALGKLENMEGVIFYGPEAEKRSGIISLNLENVHPHDVATILDQNGVAVRAGDHCGQPLMRRLDMPGSVRMSFYIYNTENEVDIALAAIAKAQKVFQ